MPQIAWNSPVQNRTLHPGAGGSLKDGRWAMLFVLAVFVGAGIFHFRSSAGDDLSSSYVGCRLLANGQAAHLFAHDDEDFSSIGPDTAWEDAAEAGGFSSYLHPYVQIPLWAKVLQPVCTRTSFRQFNTIFAVLTMLSFAGVLWLTGSYWTPHLRNGVAMAAIALLLWISVPFQYAMMLMQTHILFVMMGLAALVLAERGWPVAGGLLAAGAAAVKITPGFLLIYWVLTRRWKAAASLSAGMIVLWGASLALTGAPLMRSYRADLDRVSNVLLVSQNNQSFAAWTMGRFYPPDAIFDVTMYRLPRRVRWGSMGLLLASVVFGGMIDRLMEVKRGSQDSNGRPLGAMMGLVGGTIFAPIAWTHYFIVLIAPAMMLLEESVRSPIRWFLRGGVVVIVLLNLHPLAARVETGDLGRFAIARGHFDSGVLCLALLAWAGWKRLEEARDRVRRGSVDEDSPGAARIAS